MPRSRGGMALLRTKETIVGDGGVDDQVFSEGLRLVVAFIVPSYGSYFLVFSLSCCQFAGAADKAHTPGVLK